MAHGLSKSKYVQFCQCSKALWLKSFKPEESTPDPSREQRFKTGHEVGELAKGLFGDYVDVTTYNADGSLDINAMLEKTQAAIEAGEETICEAAFSYKGNYCAVDILRKANNGYIIYEVKGSTCVKEEHVLDVAYQKFVLQHCGINVIDCYLVCINSDYVFDGSLDIQEFFLQNYITELVDDVYESVESNIQHAHQVLEGDEPNIDLGLHCQKFYDCEFWNYCSRHLPQPSVFDVKGMLFKTKIKHYQQGLCSYTDLFDHANLNATARMVVDTELNDLTHIDKPAIQNFLQDITYPLYFFDFETMMPAIPQVDGTRPYQQVPFQYSLHYQLEKDGELYHKEFLAEVGSNPLRAIAEAIVRDIPQDVCVLVYNMSFEKTRLKELANTFPDLAEHLMAVHDNIIDLMIPFQQKWYYAKPMQGSYSIKYVLPTLYPNDPELDYHNLEEVHNGAEAMNIFPQLPFMSSEE